MRRLSSAVVVALGLLPLSGCARTLYVTYLSDPPGATLYANQTGQSFGPTPVTLRYRPSQSFFEGACLTLQPVAVRWLSGAQASQASFTACPQNGLRQQFTFTRPAEVPGADLDAQFAVQQEQRAAQLRQERLAAAAALLSATVAASNPLELPPGKIMLFGGADHRTYLGCLSCSQYDAESVFNSYGTHGSKYSTESILNAYSEFGSKYSTESACNPYATDPPVIVDSAGQYYGRLTLNAYRPDGPNPRLRAWLAGVCQ
jgi:hypothetical protein